ncbi:MAG: hypothetical protein QOC99_3163 [Acidobacteriota bacterium]|jgi:hypothetical protein|nr:hypothetical protein [Acidobacteriota bacterium]MDT7780651.1 hypothetical protein [Acidobacteriota bacterium]
MRINRRRARTLSPLSSPEAVRSVCLRLRERCPEIVPRSDRQLLLMLEAVRNVERRPATDTKRGRPPRWPREHLFEVARNLRALLERETAGRISLQTFIGQHLRILRFPADVTEPLTSGEISMQEAAQLSRLTAERLGCTPAQARARREELLRSHLTAWASQNTLRFRVKEMLGESPTPSAGAEGVSTAIRHVDELLEIDPSDTRHIFWEEMKRLLFAMREIEPEDLDEVLLNDFMAAMDEVSNVLYQIERRRRKREQQPQKMGI